MDIDWDKFEHCALGALEAPYKYGAKWPLGDPEPVGPIDCSGLTRWAFSRVGVYLPDGAHAQFLASEKDADPGLGSLGFWKRGVKVHHCGILINDDEVLEARGCDKHEGHDAKICPYNKVILRPRARWEAWKEFTGWMVPDALIEEMAR